ncbi:RpiB/LacA/LacB family sugar-phosphate isomerase [Patescibacteria group bacterium]|nr:RpiB/LacA/LacB family sugar-phosphate isomerase [Patescibacteria group bacterium]
MKPAIYIGADHAGFDLKTTIKEHLEAKGFVVEDLGAYELDPKDDYPQYSEAVAEAVLKHPGSLGVLSCGNAEGVCIAANKFEGIRAGLGYSVDAARTMRTDDDANIVCIPGRIETQDDPLKIVETFIQTPFSQAERHVRRLRQVAQIEQRHQHTISVVPAVLAYSEDEFKEKLGNVEVLKLAPLFQIDILDGSMFDQSCYADPIVVASLKHTPQIELHLMIQNPVSVIEHWNTHLPRFLERAIIHAEIDQPLIPVIESIKDLYLEAGLAINPDTSLDSIERLIPTLDLLLIMGVYPGKSGQSFLGDPILEKIRDARERFPQLKIAIDGGVTVENAPEMIEAGVNQLCVGSVIWSAENQRRIFSKLLYVRD